MHPDFPRDNPHSFTNARFEPPRVLCMKLEGEMTPDQAAEIYENLTLYSKETDCLELLVDLSALKGIPPAAREALARLPHEVLCQKLAAYGASATVRVLGSLLLKIFPHIRKSKFFKTEQEAREWLSNGDA